MSLLRLCLAALLLLALSEGRRARIEGAAQEPSIRELVSRLDDDAIQARTEAAKELVRLGKSALPELRKALDEASGERRERLAEVVKRIGERDRLSALLRPPSRVTLEAKNRPLREVFEALARQASTPLDLEEVPEGERVTVSVQGKPFWEAVDLVCRASGKVTYEADPERGAVLAPGACGDVPRRYSGGFAVFLDSIRISSSGSFDQADRFDQMDLRFAVAWERGTQPSFVRLSLLGLTDDTGADLRPAEEEAESETQQPVGPDELSVATELATPRLPDPKARKLARVRFDLELGFVVEYGGVTFKNPGTKGAEALECPQFTATLVSARLEGGNLVARVKVEGRAGAPPGISAEGFVLRLAEGTPPAPQLLEISSDGPSVTYGVSWSVGEKADPKELSVRTPVETHVERIPVELKDVPLE